MALNLNELFDCTFFLLTGSLKFEDEVTSIRSEVTNLQGQGVNKIIALGHAGFAVDTKIATEVEGVDVVIGGHTNTFLYTGKNPRCVGAIMGGGGGASTFQSDYCQVNIQGIHIYGYTLYNVYMKRNLLLEYLHT